jgi:hypothetical protein
MSPPRLTAQDRAARRDRIFARLLDGQSAAAVAAEEGITPRQVRQMVREAKIAGTKEIIPLAAENPQPMRAPAIFVADVSRA